MKKLSEALFILFSLVPFPFVGGIVGFILGGFLGLALGSLIGRFTFVFVLVGLVVGTIGGRRLAFYIARKREEKQREEEIEVIEDISDTLPGEHIIGLTLLIERPLAEVFTFLTDFQNYPQWHIATYAITPHDIKPKMIGSIYDHQLRGGDKFRAQFEITDHVSNQSLAFRYLDAEQFNFQHVTYQFTKTETGSKITHIVELSPKERQPFLFSAHRMRIWRDLFTLKRLLEPVPEEITQ